MTHKDLIVITGKGSLLPAGIKAQLQEEFRPAIRSWPMPGNHGRMIIHGGDLEAWVELNRVEEIGDIPDMVEVEGGDYEEEE
jgi:hypothetical protein